MRRGNTKQDFGWPGQPIILAPRLSSPLITSALSATPAEEVHDTSRAAAGAFVSLVVRISEFALVGPDVVRQLRLEIVFTYRRSLAVAVVAERLLLCLLGRSRVWRAAHWEVRLHVTCG